MKRAGGGAQAGEKQPAFLPAYVCASFVHLNMQNPREKREGEGEGEGEGERKSTVLFCWAGWCWIFANIRRKKGKRAPLCPDVTREVAACGDMRHATWRWSWSW